MTLDAARPAPAAYPAHDEGDDRHRADHPDEQNGRCLRSGRSPNSPRSYLARALEHAALRAPDDLVLESLEEQLPTAARAERLVSVAPRGSFATRL